MNAQFNLTKDELIYILVGQQGGNACSQVCLYSVKLVKFSPNSLRILMSSCTRPFDGIDAHLFRKQTFHTNAVYLRNLNFHRSLMITFQRNRDLVLKEILLLQSRLRLSSRLYSVFLRPPLCPFMSPSIYSLSHKW